MKPEVVPTAPSELRQRMQQSVVGPRRLGWLILSVALSLMAGIISTLFMLTVPTNWPILQQWFDRRDSGTVIVSNVESTATAEVVELLQQRAAQAIVSLYSKDVFLGIGTVVANDGWVMTTSNVVLAGDMVSLQDTDHYGRTSVVLSDRIVHDPYSDVTFIHFPLTDLPMIDFRQSPVLLGDGVIVMSKDMRTQQELVSVAHVQNSSQSIAAESSIAMNNIYYTVDRSLTGMSAGAPVFDYEGKIVGLYFKDNSIVPLRTIEHRLLTLLDTGKFKQLKMKLIYTRSNAGAVVMSTKIPELKVGDTIIQLNEQLINESNDLSWLLSESGNDTADVVLLRDDKRRTVRITVD